MGEIDLSKALNIEFLRERGYVRKRCPSCGEHFWTLDPDRETCGESPCEPYSFIGRGMGRKADLPEVREGFLSFMERNGHTRVGRYPVAARWRDDLFLTSASIVDFQPYVTAGLVPPPANPLTISQPCIRLKDVDKVGLTMGRHLTIFEMMAHHAFNLPGREIYWKDGTVELFHRYATEVLGIGEEDITYKEGIWVGGGNAGPDLEPIVGGLEIATLVFMEYRDVDGRYERMDVRVVDTGYGLERITWLVQGTPTAFEAIYGPLVDRFLSELGVEKPDRRILEDYSRISSLMARVEKGAALRELREAAARSLGVEAPALEDMLGPLERAYAILDHTKTVTFMLADGIVPSNVKEGYLARLVIRRALRSAAEIGAEVDLARLVDMQISHWSRDFPEIAEKRDRMLDMVELEQKRYEETIERGRDLVRRRLRKRGRSGEGPSLSLEYLIELYDSHGVPPEVAAEVAESEGVEVEIPDNFYEIVAARHEAPEVRPPEVSPYVDEVEPFPETELLFYEDVYRTEFDAKVLGVVRGRGILLDRTAFYPEGGGQPGDVGILRVDGEDLRVSNVEKVKGRVIHWVEGEVPGDPVGRVAHGLIDWPRRLSLMRHHTGTHIILESAKRVLGDHVWQWGAQKGVEVSRLDITHYKPVSDEEIREIEELANRVVMENRPVIASWMPRDRAEAKYGFEIYQGGVVPDLILRIVEVKDFNVQACAGTHVTMTGEVGPIKIWRARRIQDGVVRLEFSTGMAAVGRLLSVFDQAKRSAEILGTGTDDLLRAVKSLAEQNKILVKEVRRLSRRVVEEAVSSSVRAARVVEGIRAAAVEVDLGDMGVLTEAAESARREIPDIALLLVGPRGGEKGRPVVIALGSSAVAAGLSASELMSDVLAGIGRGGGRETMARGSVGVDVDVDKLEVRLLESVRRRLRSTRAGAEAED